MTLGNTSVTMTANGKPYPLSGGTVQSLKVTPHGVTLVGHCGDVHGDRRCGLHRVAQPSEPGSW